MQQRFIFRIRWFINNSKEGNGLLLMVFNTVSLKKLLKITQRFIFFVYLCFLYFKFYSACGKLVNKGCHKGLIRNGSFRAFSF